MEPIHNTAGLTPEERAAVRALTDHELAQVFRSQPGLIADVPEPMKLTVAVLVIDQIEKPTAN